MIALTAAATRSAAFDIELLIWLAFIVISLLSGIFGEKKKKHKRKAAEKRRPTQPREQQQPRRRAKTAFEEVLEQLEGKLEQAEREAAGERPRPEATDHASGRRTAAEPTWRKEAEAKSWRNDVEDRWMERRSAPEWRERAQQEWEGRQQNKEWRRRPIEQAEPLAEPRRSPTWADRQSPAEISHTDSEHEGSWTGSRYKEVRWEPGREEGQAQRPVGETEIAGKAPWERRSIEDMGVPIGAPLERPILRERPASDFAREIVDELSGGGRALAKALVLKEILDKPVALRDEDDGFPWL